MSLTRRGDKTYSNYAEANRAFWRQTVLPLVSRTANALARWLGPAWGSEITLRADLDQIEALSPEREALWARLERASFLTDHENRVVQSSLHAPRAATSRITHAHLSEVRPAGLTSFR